MILTEKSKVKSFSYKSISYEELESLSVPREYDNIHENIVRIGNQYYCFKVPLNKALINELIGSYLAKLIGLDTVDYEIGQCYQSLCVLSKVFYEEGFCYKSAYQFLLDSKELSYAANDFSLLSPWYQCQTRNLKLFKGMPIYTDILKLTALDLKMGQCDRNGKKNLQVKIDRVGTVSLAPIYDYGCSYGKDVEPIFYKKYASPFILVRRNAASLKSLFKQYPELWEYFQFLKAISIDDILGKIESSNGIILTDSEREHYRQEQADIDSVFDKVKIKSIF